jgi:hypothetical protein
MSSALYDPLQRSPGGLTPRLAGEIRAINTPIHNIDPLRSPLPRPRPIFGKRVMQATSAVQTERPIRNLGTRPTDQSDAPIGPSVTKSRMVLTMIG